MNALLVLITVGELAAAHLFVMTICIFSLGCLAAIFANESQHGGK